MQIILTPRQIKAMAALAGVIVAYFIGLIEPGANIKTVVMTGMALASIYAIYVLVRQIQDIFKVPLVHTCGHNCGHHMSGRHVEPKCPDFGTELIIFQAAKIVTMDPSWPEAKYVAVANGRICGIGMTMADMEVWLARDVERDGPKDLKVRVDKTFANKVIVPGFVEPHIHPIVGGIALRCTCLAFTPQPRPDGPDSKPVSTKKDAMDILKDQHALDIENGKDGSTLIAWGWDSIACGGHLTREDLDKVSLTRPVVVWDASMHQGYANKKAMDDLNLNKDTCAGIVGCNLDDKGELNGQFLGLTALFKLLPLFQDLFSPKNMLKSCNYLMEIARQNGVTTVAELMLGAQSLQLEARAYDMYFNNKNVAMRCVVVTDGQKLFDSCYGPEVWQKFAAPRILNYMQKWSTPKLIYNNGVKFFTDDAFLGLTMQVGWPGFSDREMECIWNCAGPGEAYAQKMLPYWKAGARIHVHSNGDAGQDATAEALACLQTAHPRFDHRFTFEHFGMSNLNCIRRVKELGACVSINTYYAYHRADINEKFLGMDRATSVARLRTCVNEGVVTAIHTDTPVAPPVPLEELWNCTNRVGFTSRKTLCENEKITAYEALKMKTVDAAFVLGVDDLVGSIEPGKFADFTVLEESPLDVPVKRIKDIKIWGTVSGGVKFPKEYKTRLPFLDNAPDGFMKGMVWLMANTSTPGTWWNKLWNRLLMVVV